MKKELSKDQVSEVIQMALSDHVTFQNIKTQYGIGEKEGKILMRENLKTGSYRAWRKRVRTFSDRRYSYK